jgi:hypothetical protein
MKPFVTLSLILILAIACRSKRGNNDQVLDLNPVMDSAYHISTVITESSSMNNMVSGTSLSVHFSLECTDIEDSLITFKLIFEKIAENRSLVKDSAGAKQQVDSPVMAMNTALQDSLFKRALGQSLTITCNTRGELTDVKGFDELVDHVTSLSREDRLTINVILRERIGSKMITDLMSQSFCYLHNGPVSKASSWVNNITLIARAPVKYSNMVTVNRISGDSVFLDIQSMMSAKTGEEGALYNQGERKGSVIASLSTGMPFKIDLNESSLYKTDTYDVEQRKSFVLENE